MYPFSPPFYHLHFTPFRTHPHWHSHTCRSVHTVSGRQTSGLQGESTSDCLDPLPPSYHPRSFPLPCKLSIQSRLSGFGVGGCSMDEWQKRCQGGRQTKKKRVLMDSRRVKVKAYWSVRWHHVRTDDPLADLNFLYHHHCLMALPHLSSSILPVWVAAGVRGSPLTTSWTGTSSHLRVTGSIWKEGWNKITGSTLYDNVKEETEVSDLSVTWESQMLNYCWHKSNDCTQSGEWRLHAPAIRTKETLTHALACSMFIDRSGWFVGRGLPRDESPSKDLSDDDQCSLWDSEWLWFGSSSRWCLLGSEGQQLL